ncbi:MAG: alpha/beta hydrolase [Chloroflexi bacterium HGW-Chloroflexi-6]|nr:MAG: alpha/beta hydrolase [Chloroflexi bacterium HGW-Chloroflexi-6]
MRQKPIFLLLFSLFLAACAPQSLPAVTLSPLTLEDCALTSPGGQQMDARCGKLSVPEDRANPDGRQITLNLAVIPAIKRTPQPDALFLLAGGPGQSAVEAFPAMLPMLYNIHEDRDIVLVDQRGTGESNPLRCLDDEDESLTEEQVLEKLKTCPERLDADLRFYTTEIAMTDLDAVRAALGYETINLYGASYGTRAALTYLRMFPERVRTLTLDAVVDADFVMFMDAAGDGQAALDKFFARCEADEACQSAFPNLKSEFDSLLSRLGETPAEISFPHPLTNEPFQLTVTPELVTNMVFNTLYVPDLVASLPLSIHAASVDENYVPLISQAFMVNAGLYDGMFYAVTCAEDAPLISAAEAARRSENSVFVDRTVDFAAVCAAWPRGQVSAGFRAPVASDVPVLILSGEADPITPPWHAEEVAESLSNDLHLVFGGMGHGNLSSRCSINLFKSFLESASLTSLDTTCVAAVQPPPFFVDFSGPRP